MVARWKNGETELEGRIANPAVFRAAIQLPLNGKNKFEIISYYLLKGYFLSDIKMYNQYYIIKQEVDDISGVENEHEILSFEINFAQIGIELKLYYFNRNYYSDSIYIFHNELNIKEFLFFF